MNKIALLLMVLPATALANKVVVLPTQFFGESPTEVPAGVFDDAVLTAVHEAGDFQVVGRDDLEAVIGLEQQKELLGCDDIACMAEIAGALDADDLVSVKVAWTEDQWTVTAKLIHLRGSPEVKSRATEFVKGSSSDLIREAQRVVAGLFGQEEPSEQPEPQPESATVDWSGVGLQGGFGYGDNTNSIPHGFGIQLNGSLFYRDHFEGILGWQVRGTALLLVGMESSGVQLELIGDATLRVGPFGPWFAGIGPFAGFLFVLDEGTRGYLPGDSFLLELGGVVETGLMLGQRKNIEVSVRGRIGTTFDFGGRFVSGMLCGAYVF